MKENKVDKPVVAEELAHENPEIAIEEENSNGSIQISNNVIASVVRKYTLEVEGVVRFPPQGLVDGIADMLSKRGYERNIDIDLGDGKALITLTLVVLFGVSVVEVAQNVQSVVKEKVEALTGVKVKKVNVFIKELEEAEALEELDDFDDEIIPDLDELSEGVESK